MGCRRQKPIELGLPLLALAAVLVMSVHRHDWLSSAARVHEGICRALISGTTVGRQALVGSLWHAPLPTLAGLPAASLIPSDHAPLAARVTAAFAVLWLLIAVMRFARRRLGTFKGTLAWLAIPLMPGFGFLTGDPVRAVTLAVATGALIKAADWCDSTGLGDLVKFAFALAFLGLCGGVLGGWVLAMLLALPVMTLANRRLRSRLYGVTILGALPLVYSLGVWALMCRLILFDTFYPWRFLPAVIDRWQGWNAIDWTPDLLLSGGLVLLGWGAGLLGRRTATATLGFMGVALLAWHMLLQAAGMPWATTVTTDALHVTALVSVMAMISWPDSRKAPVRSRAWTLGAFLPVSASLALSVAVLDAAKSPASEDRHRLESELQALKAVGRFVDERTPYGRVFLCGYEALSLVDAIDSKRLEPCLDLHIDVLREGYAGQDLFLLVPRPQGPSILDSTVWRYGNIYDNGAPRALYAGDWGHWRLYEIVSAPTAEQLQQWRQPQR